MSRVKNQHLVPQSYLRRFADAREMIWVFDKVQRRSFQSNIRGVASGRGFYDFSAEVMQELHDHLAHVPEAKLPAEARKRLLDAQFVEHELSDLEDQFKGTLDDVLRVVEETGTFTSVHQQQLAYCVTRQFLRGHTFRAKHIEGSKKLLNELSQVLLAMKFGPDAVGSVEVSIPAGQESYEHARMMYNPQLLTTYIGILLHNYFWHIGVSRTCVPLYTSDDPVVMRSHLDATAYGIGSLGMELMFPLSPRHVLILAEKQVHAHMSATHLRTTELGREHVSYYNSHQVNQSYRQVYCPLSRFDLAADLCARQPSICQPTRERVRVVTGRQFGIRK